MLMLPDESRQVQFLQITLQHNLIYDSNLVEDGVVTSHQRIIQRQLNGCSPRPCEGGFVSQVNGRKCGFLPFGLRQPQLHLSAWAR